MIADTSCVVLSGGVGAAKLLRGMARAVQPASAVTAVVNVADDIVLHGLEISPDLDTITYTLAGADNTETGWGVAGETWQAMAMLERLGGEHWFSLGDRDLGTHLYRTQRRRNGAPLSTVTAEIAAAWDIGVTIVPVTDDRIETRVTIDEGEIGFQEYFVGRRHDVAVTSVRFVGAEEASPAPGVVDAIASADVIVIAPSNPIVSIGPLMAIPAVRDAVVARHDRVVAVSPIVGGKALKGPADRLMTELGMRADVVGVADAYRDLAATLVIDDVDAEHADSVRNTGMRCVVTDTVMRSPEVAAALSTTIISEVVAS